MWDTLISREEAIAAVMPRVHAVLQRLGTPADSDTATRRRHAVVLVSQLSLGVLDALTPGHPALAAVDVFGHALESILNAHGATQTPAE